MSDEVDLTALREIASAATDGPWTHQPYGGQNQNGDYSGGSLFGGDGEYLVSEVADEDGAHIAAFDPPTALALIAHTEEAQAAVARVTELHRPMPVYDDECGDMECEREHVEINEDLYHADQIAYQACEACSDNAGDVFPEHVEYPCATRRALEGTSDE